MNQSADGLVSAPRTTNWKVLAFQLRHAKNRPPISLAEDRLNPIESRAFERIQEACRCESPAVGDRHHLHHRIARSNRHPEGNLLDTYRRSSRASNRATLALDIDTIAALLAQRLT